MNSGENSKTIKREVDLQLDDLERRINELKTLYEQFFTGILPKPPDELDQAIKLQIKNITNTPFKNTGARFRLQTLIQKYSTFSMYFERTNKKRDTGTYHRDLFKTLLKEKQEHLKTEAKKPISDSEANFKQLYNSYVNAHHNLNTKATDYETFKNSLLEQSRLLKASHGIKKINFKVALKGNKVVIKATGGE